jgi:hypothetical protein
MLMGVPRTAVGKLSYIEIPGEETFWKTVNLAPERIELPLEARARVGLYGWFLLLPGALLITLGAVLFGWGVIENLMIGKVDISILVNWAGFTAMAVGFLCPFLVLVSDSLSARCYLRLSQQGIEDRRLLAQRIDWTDIAKAKLRYTKGGVAAVELTLRHPLAARHNPFRLGAIGFSWRRRADQLHVPLLCMDVSDRRLALAILTLAKTNGAEIDINRPYGGHDPLKHH